MYRCSSSSKKHGSFWQLNSSLSEFVTNPFKHMQLILCLEVQHQLRVGPIWESPSPGAPFCSVVQSPAGDTANTDPRAASTALPEFMGSPQSLCAGLGWSLSTANPQKTSSKPSLPPDTRVCLYPAALSEASQHTLTDLSNMTPTLSTMKQWFSTTGAMTKLSNNHLFTQELFHCC